MASTEANGRATTDIDTEETRDWLESLDSVLRNDGADRARLDQAWHDLFGSWPYHDAYLGMLLDHFAVNVDSRTIVAMTPARIAALPAASRRSATGLAGYGLAGNAGGVAKMLMSTCTAFFSVVFAVSVAKLVNAVAPMWPVNVFVPIDATPS